MALELLVFLLVIFPAAAVVIATQGSGMARRSHFRVRVLLSGLGMPALLSVVIGGAELNVLSEEAGGLLAMLLMLVCPVALMLLPSLLFRSLDSSSGDGGDGPGPGPGQPPSAPNLPSGGLPLPDADPGRWRVRDHDRPNPRGRRLRRAAREPARAPARTGLGD